MNKLEKHQIKLAKKIASMSKKDSMNMKARVDREVAKEMEDM